MSDFISTTDRVTPAFMQALVVAMAVATNLVPQVSADLTSLQHTVRYERLITDPFNFPGTRIAQQQRPASIVATKVSAELVVRWSQYVTQRLIELQAGAFDFTGLRVPTAPVVNAAWAIAVGSFRPDTPTPSVLPSEDGDILFVWHKAGWDVELDVGAEGTEVWAYDRQSGREFSGSFEEHRAEFAEVLNTLAK